MTRSYFGGSSDQPVPADYNGDSRAEMGIFRSSSGLWAIKGTTRVYYGSSGDTPVSLPPGASSGSVLYQDDFSSGLATGWDPDVSADWSVVGGEYRAYQSRPSESNSMVSTYGGRTFSDFTYEVKMKLGASTGRARYMLFRATADFDRAPLYQGSGYAFGLDDTSYYIFKTSNGTFTELKGWTTSGYINSSLSWNTLKVTASGSSFTFYINGNYVYSLTDSSLSSGRIGMSGYTRPDEITTHYFDDVVVIE